MSQPMQAPVLDTLSPEEAHAALDAFFEKLATDGGNYEHRLFLVQDGVKEQRFVVQFAAMRMNDDGTLSAIQVT